MRAILPLIAVFAFFSVSGGEAWGIAQKAPKSQKMERFVGRVTAVNVEDTTITVEAKKTVMTFNTAETRSKGYKARETIKEGDRVTVQYVMEQGKPAARIITKNKSYTGKIRLDQGVAVQGER
ncbi:MAG: hypothetical protein ACYDHW_04320 [Syntrophorhabdaceae bacterium]